MIEFARNESGGKDEHTRTRAKSVIVVMQRAVRRGSLDTLEMMLRCRADEVRSIGDDADLATLASIERSLVEGREIEKRHGAGALLDLQDPCVLRCIRRGLIPAEHHIAAERYHQTNHGLNAVK